jgi:hypothetical protein
VDNKLIQHRDNELTRDPSFWMQNNKEYFHGEFNTYSREDPLRLNDIQEGSSMEIS